MHEVGHPGAELVDAITEAVACGRPAVVRLGSNHPFVTSFAPEAMTPEHGGAQVAAEHEGGVTWRGTLEELLARLDDQPGTSLYMKHITLHDIGPELLTRVPKELRQLNWLSALPPEMRPTWYWYMAGQTGTQTPLHVDSMASAAWNLLVQGVKEWTFLSPAVSYEQALLPIRAADEHAPRKIEFEQHPGDLLFTPSGWAHSVNNPTPTIAVTGNFICQANIDFAIAYFEQIGEDDNASLLGDVRRTFAVEGKL